MPKSLYIIRHAKAEEHSFITGKPDYDRSIVSKGIERTKSIAQRLEKDIKLTENTLVISSSAKRARQTAHLFCDIIRYPKDKIQEERSIYEAHYKDILDVINTVSDHIDTLLIFGHNPGLSDLTNYICNSLVDLKTSHVAFVELEEGLHFSELSGGTATLKNLITTSL